MVDDFYEVEFVHELLEDSIPFVASLTPKARKKAEKQDTRTPLNQPLEVYKQLYSGDFGGFMCLLRTVGEEEGDLAISLTQLTIPKSHPYHRELIRYQKRRIRELKRENSFNPQMFQNTG